MKAIALGTALMLLLQGCANDSTSIRTGNVGTVDKDKRPKTLQSRIFVKQGPSCDYSVAQANSALVAIVLPWAIEKGIGLVADEMKQHAAYLKADVGIQGSGYIQYDDTNFWPGGDELKDSRSGTADSAQKAIQKRNKATQTEIDSARKDAEQAFDNQIQSLSQTSHYDLCVLMVAGEYSSSPEYALPEEGSKIFNDFLIATGAQEAKIKSYQMNRPAIEHTIIPFDGLVYEPSMVAEFQLSSVSVDKKRRITITPTNIYYPAPLHKGTFNIGERKLSFEVALGEHKSTFTIPKAKSGFNYKAIDLIGLDRSFDIDASAKFMEVGVTATEGPDTLKLDVPLEAAAAQKDAVTKKALELVEKLIDKDKE